MMLAILALVAVAAAALLVVTLSDDEFSDIAAFFGWGL